jgi:tripartite-type tricarboxylate transporter receptor subunit TctC
LSRAGQIAATGLRLRIAAFLAACILAGAANGQATYPERPVRLIAPFAPGGPVDVVARLLAPKLSEIFGQPFYVENHPGASGNIGTALVAKAPGDGYTILVISSTLVVNPSLFGKLGFDTYIDLAPISLVGVSPQILLVHPSVPAHDIAELIAWVKASPGKYSYAHAGVGTPGFLAGEMFKQAFGLDLVAVSFNGGAPAMTSTIGGHTPILYIYIDINGRRLHQTRQRAAARGHRRAAFAGVAGCSYPGRGRSAQSGIGNHSRSARSQRNAAGDHR